MIEPHSESTDRLVQLVDSSAPFRLVSRAGDRIVVAWQFSAPAHAVSAWLANSLERRVRLASVVVAVAVVTHVALTGFRAPEPTWWARAAWIVAMLTSVTVGLCSRAVASAWTERTGGNQADRRRQ
jgi:hypothetical protein